MSRVMIFAASFLASIFTVNAQVVWEKLSKNPVLPHWSGDVDDPSNYRYVYSPSILGASPTGASSGYRMWFASAAFGASTYNLSYAVSANGLDWFFYSRNPVLSVGPPGSFDSRWVIDPCVIRVNDELRVYYTGFDGNVYQTGLATSLDGIHWTKYSGNPVLAVVPSTWESVNANAPRVYYDGTMFRMIYTGGNGVDFNIGYATSSDGLHWTRDESNPVLRKGGPGSWDESGVVSNCLIVYRGNIYLLYNAFGGATGLALSTDWAHWSKHPDNPVFLPGSAGTWDASLSYGSALIENDVFRYWYTGMGGGSGWQIGYASSPLTYPSRDQDLATGQPGPYTLAETYPNPFNPEATISYTLPSGQHVKITIFNALGQEVPTLVDELKQAGTHTVVWNARDCASGVYWCRMAAGGHTESRKMVLTKQ